MSLSDSIEQLSARVESIRHLYQVKFVEPVMAGDVLKLDELDQQGVFGDDTIVKVEADLVRVVARASAAEQAREVEHIAALKQACKKQKTEAATFLSKFLKLSMAAPMIDLNYPGLSADKLASMVTKNDPEFKPFVLAIIKDVRDEQAAMASPPAPVSSTLAPRLVTAAAPSRATEVKPEELVVDVADATCRCTIM